MLKKIRLFLSKILYQPYWIFLLCLSFMFLNFIVDKTLFRVLLLSRDLKIVQNRIQDMETKNTEIQQKIKKAKDPEFIEKELRERLDYTEEGDLIFLFPDKL